MRMPQKLPARAGLAGLDVDLDLRVRLAEGLLHLLGRVRLREQEAEVAVALGERLHRLSGGYRDLEPGDARYRSRRVLAADLLQRARPRDRQHHDPARQVLPAQVARVEAKRVAQ